MTKYYLQLKRDPKQRWEIAQFDRKTGTVTYRDKHGAHHTYRMLLNDPDYDIAQFDGGIAALVQGSADALDAWKPYRYCAEITGSSTDRMNAVVLTVKTMQRAAAWLV